MHPILKSTDTRVHSCEFSAPRPAALRVSVGNSEGSRVSLHRNVSFQPKASHAACRKEHKGHTTSALGTNADRGHDGTQEYLRDASQTLIRSSIAGPAAADACIGKLVPLHHDVFLRDCARRGGEHQCRCGHLHMISIVGLRLHSGFLLLLLNQSVVFSSDFR
jgi:hypothetical protein